MSQLEVYRPRDSWWDRMKRSLWLGPYSSKDPVLARLWGGPPVSSGVSVTETSALNFSAVWSAVNLISGDVAALPLMLFRRLPDGGKERYASHPLHRLLHDSPNPETSSIVFRRTLQAHALTWGGGFAEIERDRAGRPKYLWQITPDRVSIQREARSDGRFGRLVYRITNPSAADTVIAQADMIHLPGLGFDGVQGYSVVQKARESIGLGLAAERFGGTFFGNGASFGGVFEHPGRMGDKAQKNFKDSIAAQHQGVERAHKFLIVEEGMKYQRLGIPPDDAQFLETRQFQITEIARWFNVPPHKIGDLTRATFSNIEQQTIDYFQTTLVHWLETWEQELMLKLVSPLERTQQLIEHVTDGLLRADSAGRAALHAAEFQVGGLMPNEVRELANRNKVTGGDRVFVPMNMIPLDRVDDWIDAQIDAKKPPPPPVLPPANQPDDDDDDRALATALARIEALTARATEADGARWQAEQRADDLSAARAESEQQRDEARATATTVRASLDAMTADRDARLAECTTLTEQLAGQSAMAQANRQLALEAEQARVAAVAAQHEAETVRDAAIQRAETADQDRAITEQALQAATTLVEQRREAEAQRMTAVIAAHRALLVDALQRAIVKETDRARRHQATPQKLRSWVETFYPDHVEHVADALGPIVAAHLAWMQTDSDPTALARTLAEAHCRESAQQLRDVLAAEDFSPQLERLLARWEERRPAAMADRFVREGLDYVRSLE